MKLNKVMVWVGLLGLMATAQAKDIQCRVVGIADGDTLTCLTAAKTQVKVRLGEIDAPESKQPFGTAAKKQLSDAVFGKDVLVKGGTTDRYGRTIGIVYAQKSNVNLMMVQKGLAWAYVEYSKDPSYRAAQQQAEAKRIGIWSEPNPIYPQDWRKGYRLQDGRANVVASEHTRVRASKQKAAKANFACGTKQYCKEMQSCEEARYFLNVCQVKSLDGDGNGVPCEKLCRS
ncbi:MAG: thermonuclease family protein [Neisseriaceae bacterium]|nr:thermonuclease family protein [Neisseriaceae bacterium]MBP6863352.1 thermonuclease family protein [Neisseriaceae bacterium]